MLHKVVMTIFGYVFLVVGVMFLIATTATLFRWYQIQSEANFLASAQGKFGGHTTMAQDNLTDFIRDRGFDPSQMEVSVSSPDEPEPWGTPVSAKIKCILPVSIGNFTTPINIGLNAEGWDVSRYVEGKYAVTYTSP